MHKACWFSCSRSILPEQLEQPWMQYCRVRGQAEPGPQTGRLCSQWKRSLALSCHHFRLHRRCWWCHRLLLFHRHDLTTCCSEPRQRHWLPKLSMNISKKPLPGPGRFPISCALSAPVWSWTILHLITPHRPPLCRVITPKPTSGPLHLLILLPDICMVDAFSSFRSSLYAPLLLQSLSRLCEGSFFFLRFIEV